jgi:hypothetical protein
MAAMGQVHITGMGASYILLLTAFYVDNGKSLPLWKHFPPLVFWLLPSAMGIPIMIHALLRRSPTQRTKEFEGNIQKDETPDARSNFDNCRNIS